MTATLSIPKQETDLSPGLDQDQGSMFWPGERNLEANIGVRVEWKDLKVNDSSQLRSYKYVSDSGNEIERCFCGRCGSPLFTLHPAKPEFAWVKAGIINMPDIVKPAYENWVKDKVTWATISVTESHEESRKA